MGPAQELDEIVVFKQIGDSQVFQSFQFGTHLCFFFEINVGDVFFSHK
jgi:hypothetical protein